MWLRRRSAPPPDVVRSESTRCRDLGGHRTQVIVGVTRDDEVSLTTPGGETVVFQPLEVGPIRALLRDAATIAAVHSAAGLGDCRG